MEWLGVDRRRLGTAMLAFGVVGLVLAAIVAAILIAGGIAARNLDDRIATAQDQIGASLTRLTLTMDSVADSIDNASTTVQTSSGGVAHAADMLGSVAATTDSLASALDVSILGQQPFSGAAAKLNELEAQLLLLQSDATRLAADLDQNAADATQIASEVRLMRTQVAELAGAVSGFASTREVVSLAVGGIVLAGLLTAWEAVLAAGVAWMGWRLRRVAAASASASSSAASALDPPSSAALHVDAEAAGRSPAADADGESS